MSENLTLKSLIKDDFKELKSIYKDSVKNVQTGKDLDLACLFLINGMGLIERYFIVLEDYYIKYIDNKFEPGENEVDVDSRIHFDFKVSDYADKYCTLSESILEKMAKLKNIDANLLEKFMLVKNYNKRMTEIAGRWHIQRQIEVMEYKKGYRSKKLPKRLPLLKEAFFFADRMNATKMGIKFKDGIMPKRMIFAVQPNSGKSFLSNVFSNIGIILHKIYFNSSGIIRMTNTGSNAMGFSRQCKNMISSEEMKDIYPELSKYYKGNGKTTIFKKEPDEEWLLADLDASIRASMFARGRDSGINGLRNDVALVIDDLSDGFDQMNNDQAHKDMVDKYDVDMDSRKEDENVPELIVGTMFNEFDLSNTMIERAKKKYGELIQIKDKKGNVIFPNAWVSTNGDFVMVTVDCFNDKHQSIAPKLISTEKLLDKQKNMKPYQFDLVYRQIRSSREPRMFEYESLMHYSKYDNARLSDTSICILDPTRKKASDYFVLSVWRKNYNTGNYRWTDCICKQKSLGQVADPKNTFADTVADFLIQNNCTNLYIENNVSTTMGALLKIRLENKGYNFCKIEEVFNSENKLERIINMEETIKANIEFPETGTFPTKHDMSIAMDMLVRWDSTTVGKKGNFDDVPDNLAMGAKKFIFGKKRVATVTCGNLPSFM